VDRRAKAGGQDGAGRCRARPDRDGSLFYEANSKGEPIDPNKHWWAQAEAVVGFYNAYQLTGERHFLEQSERVWEYIERAVVDQVHGEWPRQAAAGRPALHGGRGSDACLVGPWKCPYHNSRVCFEMMERLEQAGGS